MVSSMTGYARRVSDTQWGEMIWELRSLNHRGVEVSVRLPDVFRVLEPQIRRKIAERFNRGRIDANLWLRSPAAEVGLPPIDRDFVAALREHSEQVAQVIPEVRNLSVHQVLNWPGALAPQEVDEVQRSKHAVDLLGDALSDLQQARSSEGAGICEIVSVKLRELESAMSGVKELIPEAEKEIRDKISARIDSFNVDVDPTRLEQEVALLLIKADITEEVDRFGLHLKEFKRTLKGDEIAGKRLGFLIQEFGRELNTLGSKSGYYPLNALTIDMKVTVEQIREQILNLE